MRCTWATGGYIAMPQGRSLYRQFAYVSVVAATGSKTLLPSNFLADEVFMSGHVCTYTRI